MAEREAVILGVGVSKFQQDPGDLNALSRDAALIALKDAGINVKDIEMGIMAHARQMVTTGMMVFNEIGVFQVPVSNIEMACAGGTRAVIMAAELISAGGHDLILVIGGERAPSSQSPTGGKPPDGTYTDTSHLMGIMSIPEAYAQMARKHMSEYGTTREQFAKAAEKAYRNACINPNAAVQKALSVDEILNSAMLADPISARMSTCNASGAAAIIVCSPKKAKEYTNNPVTLSSWVGGMAKWENPQTLLEDAPIEEMAKKAYEIAGIGPSDVGVAQVQDTVSSNEIAAIEKLGLCSMGQGGSFIWEGNTEITGKIPVNTDGGLVGCGHPMGATGTRMIAEVVLQMRGMAGKRQVPNSPKTALVQNSGLSGGNVMVFKM
ncbi:MAG: thiolase family protein [Chloroflexota bacterium]|nr:thiolase family protein [Chloroflexota bacterium]